MVILINLLKKRSYFDNASLFDIRATCLNFHKKIPGPYDEKKTVWLLFDYWMLGPATGINFTEPYLNCQKIWGILQEKFINFIWGHEVLCLYFNLHQCLILEYAWIKQPQFYEFTVILMWYIAQNLLSFQKNANTELFKAFWIDIQKNYY